jgi:hypothetical protein
MTVNGRTFAEFRVAATSESVQVLESRPTSNAYVQGSEEHLMGGFEERRIVTPLSAMRFHPTRLNDGGLIAMSVTEWSNPRSLGASREADWRIFGVVPSSVGGLYLRDINDVMGVGNPDSAWAEVAVDASGTEVVTYHERAADGRSELVSSVVPEWNWFVQSAEIRTLDGQRAVRVSNTKNSRETGEYWFPAATRIETLAGGVVQQTEEWTFTSVLINPSFDPSTFTIAALGVPIGYPVSLLKAGGDRALEGVWNGTSVEMLSEPQSASVPLPNPRLPESVSEWRWWLMLANIVVGVILMSVFVYRRTRRPSRDSNH